MTAIDIASQSKRLGAEDVTIVYRRGPGKMGASAYERELAQTDGVKIKFNAMPKRLVTHGNNVVAAEFEYTAETDGKLAGTGETFTLDADMVFKAIGQTFVPGRPRRRRRDRAGRRPHQGRRRAPHVASGRLGRRRLHLRRQGPDRRRRPGRQARRRIHQPRAFRLARLIHG